MNSEESYNPYYSLHEVPQSTHGNTSGVLDAGTIESPPNTKRRRAGMLLIFPAMFLFVIAALFGMMLFWLLYHRANFDGSFASVTKDTVIVDEAAQWCQLLTTVSRANCDKANQAQSLLGLTLSGLMVCYAIVDVG
jgi:hypothetical protein